jgi:RNA polymerase sigma-32 factor
MQEASVYPILSPEEELDLATRYRKYGDVAAAKRLVTSHLRLVAKIAMEYRSSNYNVLDLIQEGNIGLLQAVKNFDPDKGARLAHYATWWIKSYILKYILDNFRLVKIGTTKEQKKLFYNLMREKERIEAMGFAATPVELSKRLGVTEAAVEEMQKRLTTPELALEAPVTKADGDGGAPLKDFVPLDEIPADERLADDQARDILRRKFAEFEGTLSERDRKIFRERLLAELPLTLQEIAEEYGISKERVRQLEERLMERLKAYFKESGVDVESLIS